VTDRIRDAWEQRPETWLSTVILVVIAVNWFWWGAEIDGAGGSALGGYVSDGRYFLKGDGAMPEVTQAAWTWSLVHGVISVASFAVLMGIIVLYRVPRALKDYGWVFGRGPASPSEADIWATPHPEATAEPEPPLPGPPPSVGAHADRRLLDHPPGR